MAYALGIDIGTTYSAAAVARPDKVEIVQLGTHGAAIPSVVVLRDDDTVLTGEAAERRAQSEPDRVAREFKRRFGDTTPLLLGGTPQSPEAVTARLLRAMVDHIGQQEGEAPSAIAITHPANWGQYKLDLLQQAVRIAGLGEATLLSEPEAAAIHYAAQERIPDGARVAVYDLGGGTFDAAVLAKAGERFQLLGPPEGIERLGGIDFDAAVLEHVRQHIGPALAELNPKDPTHVAAAQRLRAECVAAKEALSSDTDVTIPVLLPGHHADIRMTRREFEDAIRPALGDTVAALRRALEAASVRPEDLHAVLLVGGSSRIPLVAEVLSQELGRPVAVDTHPKQAVALGAARVAAGGGAPAAAAATAAAAPAAAPEPTAETGPGAHDREPTEVVPEPVGAGTSFAAPDASPPRPRVRPAILIAALVILGAAGAGAWFVWSASDDPQAAADEQNDAADGEGEEDGSTSSTTATTEASSTTITEVTTTTEGLPEPVCVGPPCITILEVEVVDGEFLVEWETSGFVPSNSDTHAHFFWDIYEPNQVGTNAGALGAVQAPWELTDQTSFVPGGEVRLANQPAEATAICVTVADGNHAVVNPENVHCVPLPV